MIWIDLRNKLPTDADIPGWTPWPEKRWLEWLNKSQELSQLLATLDEQGKRDERNALIDANSGHWGELKPWLMALSAGKCWFSETRQPYSHYDVEHFRPKKEAKGFDSAVRDGYWWLAFDYMNFRLCGNVGNRKKGGWFPLRANSLFSSYTNRCEESEAAYLLDPIDENDVALIAFDEEGKVIPMPGIPDWDRERVIETAKRLKLNEHAQLTDERRKVWQKVDRLIEEFNAAKERCLRGNNPAAKEQMRQVRIRMREMIDTSADLSMVAKWCVLFRSDPSLSRLIA
jgi:uncharacterized protein (TIGR02646 family)